MSNPLSNAREVTIMLVEDDPGHARLVEKNLRRSNLSNAIFTLPDGEQALNFVFNHLDANDGKYSPLLMLLDLNLPVLDGYQVLERLKADERTRRIPIIVLTTTDDMREISKCYELGCNVYITKPVDYRKFSDAILKLGLFLSVIMFPNGE